MSSMWRYELRFLARERSFWLSLAGMGVLLGYAAWSGASWLAEKRIANGEIIAQDLTTVAKAKEDLAAGEEVTPYDVAERTLVFPLAPAAALAVGQADLYPGVQQISTMSRQRRMSNRFGLQNPLNLMAGRFDVAFVAVVLLPLWILSWSFDVMSAEREAGTLGLLRAQPVRVATVLLRRLTLRATAGLAGCLAVTLAALWHLDIPVDAAVLLGVALAACYGLFWLSLAGLINTLGRSSAFNAVAAAVCWLSFVVLIPTGVNIFAQTVYPPLPRTDLINEIRRDVIDFRQDGEDFAESFLAEHPEYGEKGEREKLSIAFYLIQQDLDARAAPIEERFNDQLGRQQDLVRRLSVLSPALLVHEGLAQLAGTDAERFRSFRRQSLAFNRTWNEYLGDRILRGRGLTLSEIDALPRFTFEEPASHSQLPALVLAFASLSIAAMVFRRTY